MTIGLSVSINSGGVHPSFSTFFFVALLLCITILLKVIMFINRLRSLLVGRVRVR